MTRRAELRVSLDGEGVVRPVRLGDAQAQVYARWLALMNETGVPYGLGGAYAVYAYTGAWRDSKDIDVFVRPEDVRAVLDAMRAAGFEVEIRDRLWLAKVHHRPFYMDVLFALRRSASLRVTEDWLGARRTVELLGVEVPLLGREEVVATKVYLAARDRFDGADIVHLIRAVEGRLDWDRLLELLHGDEQILLWYLVLYQIVYPGRVHDLPRELMERAFAGLREAWRAPPDPRRFRGTLLDPVTFAVDVHDWGYGDERVQEPLVRHDGSAL